MLRMLAVLSVMRLVKSTRNEATDFTVPTADILTQAKAIFNSFGAVLAMAIGLGLGVRLLGRVKGIF